MRISILILLFCVFVSAQENNSYDAEIESSIEVFQNENISKGLKKGKWIIDYHKNGKVKREGIAKNYKKESGYSGLILEYSKKGVLIKKLKYQDGHLNGICREYFKTGELKRIYRYKDSRRNGVWKEFYPSGKIKTKGKYKNGERVGVWKTYYKNTYESFFDY